MTKAQEYGPESLETTLKKFAFKESPQFRDNQFQDVSVERNFGFNFDNSGELSSSDAMWIKVGFQAVRDTMDFGPAYNFYAYCEAVRDISADELQLAPADWTALGYEFEAINEDQDIDDKYLPTIIRPKLIDNGAEMTRYMHLSYNFSTIDYSLGVQEYQGYKIDDEFYGVVDRSDFYGSDYTEAKDTEEDNSTQTDSQFDEVVAQLRLDIEDDGDLMPFEDRQREMQAIIEAIAKRKLRNV